MYKPKLLLAMPLPPPYSGQETITQILLTSPLSERFEIIHLDTSNKASNVNRGQLNLYNSIITLKNLSRLLRLLWQERPQIANIPMPKNRYGFIKFFLFVLPCVWSGVKVVSRSGGGHFDKFYEGEASWMQTLIRYTVRRLDAVIVRANCLKKPFTPFLPPERIWTVYLGLDSKMFEELKVDTQGKGGIDVLYTGLVSKAKGAIDLLQAIPKVLNQHPNTRFNFAGEVLKKERNITFIDNPNDIHTRVNTLINKLNIGHAVEMLGVVTGETKLQTFIKSDLFVLPSYAEGFPFAVLEAMLAGKAVITTPVGALPEVFDHEKELLFVKPGDVEGIAKAINRLIKDTELRESLGQTARKTVKQQFNLKTLADRMETVFKNVLED